MNKKELAQNVAGRLKDGNIKKTVRPYRHTITISDNEGTSKNFTIKRPPKDLLFTERDVMTILDCALDVVLDALKCGDNVSINGFGTIGLKYRKPRYTKNPNNGEVVDVPGHYIPKLSFGKGLRLSARLYELSLGDGEPPAPDCA